jgi:hypothetical protein
MLRLRNRGKEEGHATKVGAKRSPTCAGFASQEIWLRSSRPCGDEGLVRHLRGERNPGHVGEFGEGARGVYFRRSESKTRWPTSALKRAGWDTGRVPHRAN